MLVWGSEYIQYACGMWRWPTATTKQGPVINRPPVIGCWLRSLALWSI